MSDNVEQCFETDIHTYINLIGSVFSSVATSIGFVVGKVILL